MSMRIITRIQRAAILLLIVSVAAMGVEIFINDLENIRPLWVFCITAIVCLHVNAFAAIWKLWRAGTKKEKGVAATLAVIVAGFWMIKLI